MSGKIRVLLVLAILLGLQRHANSQDLPQELPRAPVPVTPSSPLPEGQASSPPPMSPPRPIWGDPQLAPLPPPPPLLINPYQDVNGPLLRGDPLLDRPEAPPPGWFAGVEFDLVGTHIKNRLQAPVTINGFLPDTVHVPGAELDWTGSPRFELGYRFAEGCGEIVLSYRFLVTEGETTLVGIDLDGGDVLLKSRLNMNVVDLDYASREFSLWPRWDMKWRAGVRFATVFFDSGIFGQFIEERTSNNFYGAGPHLGLDLWRAFDVPGWGLFARIEGASVVGQLHQAFEEIFVNQDGSLIGGATLVHHTQAAPVLTVQAGLSWTPLWRGNWSRYSFGYEFERWWNVGEAGDSRAEITTQGVFLRAEFKF
jgi:hypothetical protein